jgi:hypothetical protein
MYEYLNTEQLSCNHSCIVKAISITYSMCVCMCVCVRARVCVELVIQHAIRLRHFVIYGLSWPVRFYNIFPHYFIIGTIFEKQLLGIKCVFCFALQLCPKHFSF